MAAILSWPQCVKVMVWPFFDAKPLPGPILLSTGRKFSGILKKYTIFFFPWNLFINVFSKMAVILFRPHRVKCISVTYFWWKYQTNNITAWPKWNWFLWLSCSWKWPNKPLLDPCLFPFRLYRFIHSDVMYRTLVQKDHIYNSNMMTSWHGNTFRITGPLWGESIFPSWRANNPDLWCFL